MGLEKKVPDSFTMQSSLNDLHLLDNLQVDSLEDKLNQYLMDKAAIMLLPGTVLSTSEQGFFRLCYTGEEIDVVITAIRRMADALDEL